MRAPSPHLPSVLQDVSRWARATLASEPLLLDTETTGLTRWAEVVELGVTDALGATLLLQRFRPERHFDPAAARVNGLSAEILADTPPFAECHARVCALLHGRNVLAFNAPYDKRLIEQTCDRYGLDRPQCRWLCAQSQAQQVLGKGKWVSLSKALHVWTGWTWATCKEAAHGSIGDCTRLLRLLEYMIEYRCFNGREIASLLDRAEHYGAW